MHSVEPSKVPNNSLNATNLDQTRNKKQLTFCSSRACTKQDVRNGAIKRHLAPHCGVRTRNSTYCPSEMIFDPLNW